MENETTLPQVEEWRPVKGYEGYEVSNLGRLFSRKTNTLLKGKIDEFGRVCHMLYANGKHKNIRAHRFVAIAFLGLDETRRDIEVNHMDGNKRNNCVSNLELCSRDENVAHANRMGLYHKGEMIHGCKLNEVKVRIIKVLLSNMYHKDLASMFGVTRVSVTKIKSGKNWKHI